MKKEYKKYLISKTIEVPAIDKFEINKILEHIEDVLDVNDLAITVYNFLEMYSIERDGLDFFEEDPDGEDENEVIGANGTWIPEEDFDKKHQAIMSIGWWDNDNDYIYSDFHIIAQIVIDDKDVDEFIRDFGLFAEKFFMEYKSDYSIKEIEQ